MIKYSSLNYQGIDFGAELDLSSMEYVHLDVWTSNVDSMDVYMINAGPIEKKVTPKFIKGAWTSVDIALTEYTSQGMTLDKVFQIKFDDIYTAGGTIFVDNIYFYKVPTPQASAPSPTHVESDVTSIYSQSFMDPAAINYYPGWGQSTQFRYFEIGTDSMIEYSNLNYQGMEFGETIDASGMDSLHMDVWSTSVTNLEVYPISIGSGEKQVTATLTPNAWNRVGIALSEYTAQGLSVNDLHQFKFVDPDGNQGTIYLDNVYFSMEPTGSVENININVNIYPNPATSIINVQTEVGNNIESVQIIDIAGKIVAADIISISNNAVTINTSELSQGVYMVQLNTTKGISTNRVIVE